MTSGPFPNEQVHASDFEQLVTNICQRPSMFVCPPSYETVCAYLTGFDAARNGGPLTGLHPWLVLRCNEGNNLVWQALASKQLALWSVDTNLPEEDLRIRALGRMLAEFFEYRRDNGTTKIFYDYAKWLLRRSWYDGPLRQKPASPPTENS
jgi:hypothetical protein